VTDHEPSTKTSTLTPHIDVDGSEAIRSRPRPSSPRFTSRAAIDPCALVMDADRQSAFLESELDDA